MITLDDVRSQVFAIVAENPERHYARQINQHSHDKQPRCLYVHNKEHPTELQEGCIGAVWLHRYAGISLAHLSIMDGVGDIESGVGDIESVIEHLGLWIEDEAKNFLLDLQAQQDLGVRWVDAMHWAWEQR